MRSIAQETANGISEYFFLIIYEDAGARAEAGC
jgi:hypothetical protein